VARVEVVDGATVAEPVPRRRLHLHRSHRPVVVTRPVPRDRTGVVRHISLWSVTRMALAFWTGMAIFLAVTALVLWGMLSAMGVIGNIESLFGQLTDDAHFHLAVGDVVVGGTLGLCAFVCIATVITVGAAAFYNVLASLTGGLEVELRASPIESDQQAVEPVRSNGQADDTVVL
jgi:hypothetical protein